jgi:hypothetical protein
LISSAQFACSILIYSVTAACVSAQAVPTKETIIASMAQAQVDNRTRFRPYIVTRDYRLFEGQDENRVRSHVVAEMTIMGPESKTYAIENASGSGLAERVVRKMLDAEVAVAKDSASTDITRENYDFLLVREDELGGRRCYVLQLVPRRKSKALLRGTIWVDAGTYLPHLVEGEPAKSPSWWVKDVRIVLLYGYVGEMWMQTSSQATANVRILGQSTMVSRDVKYQIGVLTLPSSLAPAIISAGEMTAEGQR